MTNSRRFFYLSVGLLLGSLSAASFAATVAYKFNGMNVTREAGVTHLRGTSPSEFAASGATVSNHIISGSGSANWYVGTGALLQSGGVVFNAAVPIAATAAAVAVTAVRANPAGLITSAVASYLLSKGISYVDGQFKQSGGDMPANPFYPSVACKGVPPPCGGPNQLAPNSSCYTDGGGHYTRSMGGVLEGYQAVNTCGDDSIFMPLNGTPTPSQCLTGTWNGSSCTGEPVPATESAWDGARVGYWPDPAIYDLVKAGVPLPTDHAIFTPDHKDVPLSDPYLDPVTGKRYQDVARVTPQPSAPDTATVQTVKQEVDANGQPVLDQGTGQPVPPEAETDLCKLNPDASGCKPLDEVPDVELEENTITLSISPISGFGPDTGTCPSPRSLFSKGGQPVVWEWTQYCDFASGIRPLIIGFAWISALMIVIGVARRNS